MSESERLWDRVVKKLLPLFSHPGHLLETWELCFPTLNELVFSLHYHLLPFPTMREQHDDHDHNHDQDQLDVEHIDPHVDPQLDVDLHDEEHIASIPHTTSAADELASYGDLDLAAEYENIDPFLMQASHLHQVHQPTHPEPSRHFGAILDAIGAASEPMPAHPSDVALVSMFENPEWSTSRQAQVRLYLCL